MFGFLTPGTKEALDPLASPKAVAAWLRQLPALDVIGRQQQVMRAFEAMKASRKPCDIARVQAIEYLDAALGADRRQLTKQYVENYDSAPKLAERIWQSIYDLSQGFIYAYQTALEEALQQSGNARWKPLVPLLFARLTHYYGTDAKLRVFRFERWIPGKWVELHRTYLRATELGVDRVAATLGNGDQNATPWTIEQEYIYVLLIHQLNTGNMSPPQIDWATAQLRAWSRRLQIDAVPRSLEGFFVDIAGRTGPRTAHRQRFRFDAPLPRHDAADGAARPRDRGAAPGRGHRPGSRRADQPAAHRHPREGLRRRWRPTSMRSCAAIDASSARSPRRCASGCPGSARNSILKDNGISLPEAGSPHEQIEVFAVADGSRAPRRVPDEHDSLVASLSSFSDPMWQVRDRSVAGLRIAASGGIGQSLSLGTLVAVRQSDVSDWVLGVVRRMNKVSTDEVEAGMSIIADRMVSVTLHAVRQPKDDMGFIVDGIDISTMGARFHGLYLPPPSRPDKPLSVKTLIIPTQEYSEGRNVILTTGRSVYTVALRHLVEQRAEWSWTAIQIIEKKSRV